MTFYLGTHHPHWLGTSEVPLFISRRRLEERKSFPRARTRWCLDSGGFTELDKFHRWTLAPHAYAAQARKFRDEIGNMYWAAPQDWMCEREMLKKTGLSVAAHQSLTLTNYLELLSIAPDVPWIPVLQGWTESDYIRHADQYEHAGIRLNEQKTVGMGSVCRRENTAMVESLVQKLHGRGIKIHGFGMKTAGVGNCARYLESSDSMAWSSGARNSNFCLPGHEATHKNCANCREFALIWRGRVIEAINRGHAASSQMVLL